MRTEFFLHHNHSGIRALVYPEGVKGVQPPLNVFNCFCQKILSKLCSFFHYILNFVRENVRNCTRTLIYILLQSLLHFTSSPDPWLGPLLEIPHPSPVNFLCYKNLGSPMSWKCFKCLISASSSALDPVGELIALPQNP